MSVCDTSDPDWWKAKFLGRVGFFPSKYCARLSAGERPLQVIQNLQLVESGDRTDCTMTLLRDQIVVQVCMHYMNAMQMQYVDSVSTTGGRRNVWHRNGSFRGQPPRRLPDQIPDRGVTTRRAEIRTRSRQIETIQVAQPQTTGIHIKWRRRRRQGQGE